MTRLTPRLAGLAFGLILSGCQTAPAPVPAVLAEASPEDLSEIRRVAGLLLDRPLVQLGAGDLRHQSVVSVLPPRPGPRETHSLAQPVQLDLVLIGEGCHLVLRTTGTAKALSGVRCVPL